ncbi:uncharacterized protein LOC127863298 isoform X2 [Dreissena polymorpha]|nr:uncharacterized protein LOC127863298 isoform X2 [Dreissena polymorpha]
MDALALSGTESEFSSRRSSFIDRVQNKRRKDSVAPFVLSYDATDLDRKSSQGSVLSVASSPDIVSGTDRVRSMNRRLSLKPPSNVYNERRKSRKSVSFDRKFSSGNHKVHCDCGRNFTIPCMEDGGVAISSCPSSQVPAITLSRVNSKHFVQAIEAETSPLSSTPDNKLSTEKRKSLVDTIECIKTEAENDQAILQCCQQLGKSDDQDSLEMVLSRQSAVKSLLEVLAKYVTKPEIQLEACTSLLIQIKCSEATLHYLTENEGIERLHDILTSYVVDSKLLIVVLDIFGYYSFQDEWRSVLIEKVNPAEFLRIMSCHNRNSTVVEKCCVVLENLALSEDIARSMMYVGGVHSILSMMSRYDQNVEVLKHCCTTLGTFASHDETCQVVAEAGAVSSVMSVMSSYTNNAEVQQSCCWALASLSRSGTVCLDLLNLGAVKLVMNAMSNFQIETSIQEYGCWTLCNLVVLATKMDDAECEAAVEVFIDCTQAFSGNVELLEHICFGLNALVAVKECVHATVVRHDGISKLIELMKKYELNVDIQVNSSKVIGNLAVNDNFRRYVEDMGASEAVISSMLGLEKNRQIQMVGCMTLTNISAEEADNKFRILKNGGVHAALHAMKKFKDDESINLNALKLFCNLIESDKGCWWIAEESGIQVISMALKHFSANEDIMAFGCTCLANLPRRGMNKVALESAESMLLYLKLNQTLNVDMGKAVCTFYENAQRAGTDCLKLVDHKAIGRVLQIMDEFLEDEDIQVIGCKLFAHIALGEDVHLLPREALSKMTTVMRTLADNVEVQLLGCGTISCLSGKESGLLSLESLCCLEAVIESMHVHPKNAELHCVCLLAIENMCQADVVRGNNIQKVCDSITRSMKLHDDNTEIMAAGNHVLTIIGKGFHKQNGDIQRTDAEVPPYCSLSCR